jgi:hypothetical protein
MTWPHQSDVREFYGNPNSGGHLSCAWYAANIVMVDAVLPLHYGKVAVHKIAVHRKCADSLTRVLQGVAKRYYEAGHQISGQSASVDAMDRSGVTAFDGSFCFRCMRGGNSLSMHSYGIALDFDAAHNPFHGKPRFTPASILVQEFEREGWTWGGRWRNPDGMHFQAATTG